MPRQHGSKRQMIAVVGKLTAKHMRQHDRWCFNKVWMFKHNKSKQRVILGQPRLLYWHCSIWFSFYQSAHGSISITSFINQSSSQEIDSNSDHVQAHILIVVVLSWRTIKTWHLVVIKMEVIEVWIWSNTHMMIADSSRPISTPLFSIHHSDHFLQSSNQLAMVLSMVPKYDFHMLWLWSSCSDLDHSDRRLDWYWKQLDSMPQIWQDLQPSTRQVCLSYHWSIQRILEKRDHMIHSFPGRLEVTTCLVDIPTVLSSRLSYMSLHGWCSHWQPCRSNHQEWPRQHQRRRCLLSDSVPRWKPRFKKTPGQFSPVWAGLLWCMSSDGNRKVYRIV